MLRVYVSSTFLDLHEHREAVYRGLRRLKHDVLAMEDLLASDERPLIKCLAEVAACDIYVGIFAWRYGYIPPADNPDGRSITELEYREATRLDNPRLIFLLSDDARWPPRFVDKGADANRMAALREHLQTTHVTSTFATKDQLAELVASAVTSWEREHPRRRSADDVLRSTERFSALSERKVGGRYRPELYVSRPQDDDLFARLHEESQVSSTRASLVVLVERAGSGKTNLVCRLTERLLAEGSAAILLLGSEPLSTPEDLTAYVVDALRYPAKGDPASLADALDLLADSGRRLYVLLDALNEARDINLLKASLRHLLASVAERRVSLLATCRDIYWAFVKGNWLDVVPTAQISLDMYRFDWTTWPAVRRKYFDAYRITGELSPDAENACRHPLLFRFFCEAYEGDEVSIVHDLRLKPLFDRYLEKKVGRIAEERDRFREDERVVRILERIASELVDSREVSLSEARMPEVTEESQHLAAGALYIRLLDEDIMIEEVPDPHSADLKRRVRFVYEAFLEYMIARVLERRWRRLSNGEIVEALMRLLEPTAAMRNVLGSLVFLEVFFIERELMYWRAFMQRGHVWQAMAVRTLRETPPEDMNVLHEDAFRAALELGSPDIRREAIDLVSTAEARERLDPQWRALLSAMEHDPRFEVRLAALWAVADDFYALDGDDQLRICRRALDRSKEVRGAALGLFSRLPAAQHEPLFEILQEAAHGASRRVRSYAVRAVDPRRFRRGAELLAEALHDEYQWVRRAALIQMMAGPEMLALIDPLTAALSDQEPRVRSLAAQVCGKWRTPTLAARLTERLNQEPDGVVLSRVVEALVAIGIDDVRGVCEPLLEHPNYWVRRHAGKALFAAAGVDALPLMIAGFERSDQQRWPSDWPGLEALGGPEGLLAMFGSRFRHDALPRSAAAFMAGLGTIEVVGEAQWSNVQQAAQVFLREGEDGLILEFLRGLTAGSARRHFVVLDVCDELLAVAARGESAAGWAAFLIGSHAEWLSADQVTTLLGVGSLGTKVRLAEGLATRFQYKRPPSFQETFASREESSELTEDDDVPLDDDVPF